MINITLSYLASFLMSFVIMTVFWVIIIIIRDLVLHNNIGATVVVTLSALIFTPKYRRFRNQMKGEVTKGL